MRADPSPTKTEIEKRERETRSLYMNLSNCWSVPGELFQSRRQPGQTVQNDGSHKTGSPVQVGRKSRRAPDKKPAGTAASTGNIRLRRRSARSGVAGLAQQPGDRHLERLGKRQQLLVGHIPLVILDPGQSVDGQDDPVTGVKNGNQVVLRQFGVVHGAGGLDPMSGNIAIGIHRFHPHGPAATFHTHMIHNDSHDSHDGYLYSTGYYDKIVPNIANNFHIMEIMLDKTTSLFRAREGSLFAGGFVDEAADKVEEHLTLFGRQAADRALFS